MSDCTGLRGQLAAEMHSGGWEPPRYRRLKPNLLGALEPVPGVIPRGRRADPYE
jgi:hypothetical protein